MIIYLVILLNVGSPKLHQMTNWNVCQVVAGQLQNTMVNTGMIKGAHCMTVDSHAYADPSIVTKDMLEEQ